MYWLISRVLMSLEIKLSLLIHSDLFSVFVWTLESSGSKQVKYFCSLFTHLIQYFGTWVVGFPLCYKRSQVPTLFPWLLMKPLNLVTISISHKLCMPLILLMYAYMHGLCQTILFPMVLIPSPTIAFWCFPNLTLTHLDLPFAFN